ncbi:hypothetical protein ACHAXN_000599 [Cyclotella atomus]
MQLINRAAQYIGAVAALQTPVRIAVDSNRNQPLYNWWMLKVKILAVVRFQRPLFVRQTSQSLRKRIGSLAHTLNGIKSFNRQQSFHLLSDAAVDMKNNVTRAVADVQYAAKASQMKWLAKLKGGKAFVGIASKIIILAHLDQSIAEKTTGRLSLVMPPIGALSITQWNLTAAPASQPRNALLSQIIALTTAFCLHHISSIDSCTRCALAPTITAFLTGGLGIIHAPAGASAVAF